MGVGGAGGVTVRKRGRRKDLLPSKGDIAEVAAGKGSSHDKMEVANLARRHPRSKAAKVIKRVGYKPRPKARKRKRVKR
jgi:hypothetical protein